MGTQSHHGSKEAHSREEGNSYLLTLLYNEKSCFSTFFHGLSDLCLTLGSLSQGSPFITQGLMDKVEL
jgi:hypothetical protein